MKASLPLLAIMAVMTMFFAGCASVDVTQTAKGHYNATNPNDVEILKTKPDRPYTKLGTVTVTGYAPTAVAKMYNAIRTKSAPLGADAVILLNEGMSAGTILSPAGGRWATGVAIKYKQ